MAGVKRETLFYMLLSLSCGLTFARSPDLHEEGRTEGQSRKVKPAGPVRLPHSPKDSPSLSLGRNWDFRNRKESWDSVKDGFPGAEGKAHCQYLSRGKSCMQRVYRADQEAPRSQISLRWCREGVERGQGLPKLQGTAGSNTGS